jgi:hypothetical protein
MIRLTLTNIHQGAVRNLVAASTALRVLIGNGKALDETAEWKTVNEKAKAPIDDMPGA